jgi:hypothetical protein
MVLSGARKAHRNHHEDDAMNRRTLLALATTGLALAGTAAMAQAPSPATPSAGPARLRGVVNSVSADTLQMTTRAGMAMTIKLPENLRVNSMFASKLADVQPGSYIGSAATPQPDGTLRALQVTIFPPAARGTAEGHFPWDLTPSSTMTNGTVGNITSANGRVLTVKYGNAEKQILVPEDVPVVSFEPGTRELLVPGAQIILNGTRAADGTVTAGSISVGKDGLIPPN